MALRCPQTSSVFDSAGALENNVDGTQTLTFNFKDIWHATGFRFHLYHKMAQLLVSSLMSQSVMMAWLLLYSNGVTTKLGMVALAKFSNPGV